MTLRVLAVGDDDSALMDRVRELAARGIEIYRGPGTMAGLVLVGRVRPDVVLLDLSSASAHAEEWRRFLVRHRLGHPLGILLISPSASVQRLFSGVADLGIHDRCPDAAAVPEPVQRWENDSEPLSRAG